MNEIIFVPRAYPAPARPRDRGKPEAAVRTKRVDRSARERFFSSSEISGYIGGRGCTRCTMAATKGAEDVMKLKPNVSKKKLSAGSDDFLAVRKAFEKVVSRSVNVGQVLGLNGQRLKQIDSLHSRTPSRIPIAVIDTWLRETDVDFNSATYSRLDRQHKCPSLYTLVWAVAHRQGGNSPAVALTIIDSFEAWKKSTGPEHTFGNVSSAPLDSSAKDGIVGDLLPVWSRWYEIGVALKMATFDLDQIALQKKDLQDQIEEMIANWIDRSISEPATWRSLLQAVATSYGGANARLADELAKQHLCDGSESVEEKSMEEEIEMEVGEGESTTKTTGQNSDTGLKMDSAVHHATVHEKFQLTEDGGPTNVENFIVYSRNAHKPSSTQQPHGVALIISNEAFDPAARLTERKCSPWDDRRLKETLKALGYRVVLKKNKTASEIEQLFESIQSNPSMLGVTKDDDSFICCISSHGDWDAEKNTDIIYGRDRGKFYLHKVAYEKLNAVDCPILKEKPKLFFVQACRGGGYGTITDDSGTRVPPTPQLPRESDFLISYSTAPETKSFRYDPGRTYAESGDIDTSIEDGYGYKVGSFYITHLCDAFNNYATRLDLMTMVLSVHQILQAAGNHIFTLEVGSKVVQTRQCPHLTTSIRGPIFFFDEAESLYRGYMKKSLK